MIGEVRGAEALDMLQAMNTGHDGSLSTGHGNSPIDMIRRIETMVLMGMSMNLEAVRGQIAGGLDILIHLGRLRDGSRKVLEITEVVGMRGQEIVLNPLYQFQEDEIREDNVKEKIKGSLQSTGNKLQHTEKLLAAGFSKYEAEG